MYIYVRDLGGEVFGDRWGVNGYEGLVGGGGEVMDGLGEVVVGCWGGGVDEEGDVGGRKEVEIIIKLGGGMGLGLEVVG